MALLHGRKTKVTINASDISIYTKSTNFDRSVKTHDVTTYGPNRESESYEAGLTGGKITLSGVYDDTVSGPDAILTALMDAKAAVAFVLQMKGTGPGRPQKTCQVIVEKFAVSDSVDDMVQWTAELQPTGDVNSAPQA
jgi:hypothetical protein